MLGLGGVEEEEEEGELGGVGSDAGSGAGAGAGGVAAEGADALVVSTGWPEFRALDFEKIKRLLKRPIIVDTKNLLDSVRLRSMGYQYVGVGRN